MGQGLSPEEVQKEFKNLAIKRYKNNGINNIKLFCSKFVILSGNLANFTFDTFNATITLELFLKILKLCLHIYITALIFLNLLHAIQSLIYNKYLKEDIFYMLFYIGIIAAHLFVEVSPRYYTPALVPLSIIASISIYKNLKLNIEENKND